MSNIETLLKEAVARVSAMTPAERAIMDYEQRRSFVRGMCPSDRDYDQWCAQVEVILPAVGSDAFIRQQKALLEG